MRRNFKSIFSIIGGLLLSINSDAQIKFASHENKSRWCFEYHFGAAYNAKLPLTFIQNGYPEIYIAKAEYATEPFVSPHYWNWRFTKWFKKDGISFETIHHKIYLKNKPPEVERFGISHGYNMLLFNYHKNFNWFNGSIGAGSVLAHPESTIRGKVWPEGPGFDIHGYYLRGWVLNFGVCRQIRIYKRFYLDTEFKVTFSKSNIPIVDGYAKVNSIAFQLIFGPGIDFGFQKK